MIDQSFFIIFLPNKLGLSQAMQKQYVKSFSLISLSLAFSFIIVLSIRCSGRSVDETEAIMDMYYQTMKAFSREDLRGVMKNISKDFHSTEADQHNYDELFEFRKLFILNNSNLSIEFREIRIIVEESKATAKFTIHLHTDQMTEIWEEIDTLEKTRGDWKIVSWNKIRSR